jgi:thiamine-monophosphate kinase
MGEFELIEHFFNFSKGESGVALGVGDDCALLECEPNMQWAISSDMLVQGVHFFADVDPERLGQKALAVNLSDLAACGAKPRAYTLSLSMPSFDEAWLRGFAKGLKSMSQVHACPLIGGDTCKGPLTLAITVMGEVPKGQALLRSTAVAGDDLYVSGHLGIARAALLAMQGKLPMSASELARLRLALECPSPRLALGQALRGVATSAMDLSDGLAGDLVKLMRASSLQACVDVDALQGCVRSEPFMADLPQSQRLELMLTGGDDYELVFTAPRAARQQLQELARPLNLALTRIGHMQAREHTASQVLWHNAKGEPLSFEFHSFDHFS